MSQLNPERVMQENLTGELVGRAENEQFSALQTPLRLWPGMVIAIALALLRYGVPLLVPDAEIFSFPLVSVGMIGGITGAVAILVWWLFFSRAPWAERAGAIAMMIIALLMTRLIVHESIAGAGKGRLLYVSAIPILSLVLVVWAAATRRFPNGARRGALVTAILLACAPWALLRTAGIIGAGSEYHWRWTATPEQRLLAQANDEPQPIPAATPETPKEPLAADPEDKPAITLVTPPTMKTSPATRPLTATPAAWPGFRGRNRDGVVRGVQINTDWSAAPPVEMWRRPIGPGWSSFAVSGDLLYTQEQRGKDEIVACYKVSTGEPVWRRRDAARFWESNGGAGPRATPTLDRDRVYAFGATGILNALDAATGKVVWSRNAATDTDMKAPDWGFASSPLVIDNVVIVAVSGTLAAYDVATGEPRWVAPSHSGSYSSPHQITINGINQALLLHGAGVMSVAPADGKRLWEHTCSGEAIVQPSLLADGDILISTGGSAGGIGTRRLSVDLAPGGADRWTVETRWTSRGLKPYFNDYVVHNGHAFGFDGPILACINLADGQRKWKGGRYGNGQLVLLPEQNLLLVLSEEGELALVSATTDQFSELARFPAIKGKTWNHPALFGDVLLVRNGEEMAAFRLSRSVRLD
jgi:outer membrane protein assembly factor BamB